MNMRTFTKYSAATVSTAFCGMALYLAAHRIGQEREPLSKTDLRNAAVGLGILTATTWVCAVL